MVKNWSRLLHAEPTHVLLALGILEDTSERLLEGGLVRRLRLLVLQRHHRGRWRDAGVDVDGVVAGSVVLGGELDFPVGGVWHERWVAALLQCQEGMSLVHLIRLRAR